MKFFFGAIWAAKEFGIEIYDYQHGIQGDYHFAYSKWLNMPVNGYTFLPNFLVYSSLDKISLDASFTSEKHPKSFRRICESDANFRINSRNVKTDFF